MATYLHGSTEIQGDSAVGNSLQTLFLMTPNNYLTATGHGYSDTYHVLHPTQSHHHHHHQYNLLTNGYNQGGQYFPHLPVGVGSSIISEDLNRSFSSISSSSSSILGTTTTTGTHQGLSLSLSYRQQQVAAVGGREDTSASNGRDVVMGSKYLKAAQQLLDEVVKVVGNQAAAEGGGEGERREKLGKGDQHGREEGSGGGGTSGKRGHDQLTTAQRQELQMKKAKLVNMLDEVEQRYKQYHNQMQIVVASFEQASGTGSTKSYTALALHTISKQFRCLKDTIASQIKAVAGGLGEDDGTIGTTEGSTKVLKFVDQQLRQQRALHQIGMIMPHQHHNAWRPQRGLPETAVSVLRAWLFEHFLHPYPKDSDKQMLAKQTGLTRSQVSNWFINARVRLWKPMVEEMYLEEMKQHDHPENNNNNNIIVGNDKSTITNYGQLLPNKELLLSAGESKSLVDDSPQIRIDHHHQTNSNNIINKYPASTFHLEQQQQQQILCHPNHLYSSPKKPKPLENNEDNINGGSMFGTYPRLMGHDDQDEELAGAGFHDFLSNQMVQTSHFGDGMSNNIGYETINNNRKRFAAPLLPDFVA